MQQKIVVAGDLILDYNLVQHSTVIAKYHEPLRETVLHQKSGGAWHLKNMVELACSDIEPEKPEIQGARQVNVTAEPNVCVSRAYTIWSLQNCAPGGKGQVWRISQFLGCQVPPAESPAVAADEHASVADVLVIDDLGLGFRNEERLWPAALRDRALTPPRIVLKAISPLAEGLLWKRLWENYKDRLTVVLPVAALKARRAAISESLSWDRTIEETVQEFESGVSSRDLAQCRRVVVHFGDAGAASFTRCRLKRNETEFLQTEDLIQGPARLERFLYQPEEMIGMWRTKYPGETFGATSIVAAAVTRHELTPASFPITIALKRALRAVRLNHRIGGGAAKVFSADAANEKIAQTLHGQGNPDDPAAVYCTAFPHELLSDPKMKAQPSNHCDLLRDLTGAGLEYVAAKAIDVVLRGPDEALKYAPKARYGNYLTVDREEIERINAIRGMIVSYQSNSEDRKPLAIAVFGPPGSGKSFAIKELAAELFGSKKATIEFNLSQFQSVGDLHTAFHQVRDAAVQSQIPLVFWDEFDSGDLKWLKEFLAPIQDAKFQSGSITFPFGKAIFVFAGGTSADFERFDRSNASDKQKREDFRRVKGPDFVSRLRGYVNIKGPDPVGLAADGQDGAAPSDAAERDVAYLIRRALLLRSVLERFHGHLIDRQTKVASVSASVIRGFLRVDKYFHGARSLEALVNMSTLANAPYFGVAELPSRDLLKLHVPMNFIQEVQEGQLEANAIEALSRNCHQQWYDQRTADGWKHAPVRNDASRGHPLMLEYDKLPTSGKEKNRVPARLTHAKLDQLGYRIVQRSDGSGAGMAKRELEEDEIRQLMRIEHDIWLRDQLLQGYEYAPKSDDSLLLHKDATTFENVPDDDQKLDSAIGRGISDALWQSGYTIVKRT